MSVISSFEQPAQFLSGQSSVFVLRILTVSCLISARYIRKPDFMCRTDRSFDPFAESTVDGIIAGSVEVKVSRTIKGIPSSFPCRIAIYHAII